MLNDKIKKSIIQRDNKKIAIKIIWISFEERERGGNLKFWNKEKNWKKITLTKESKLKNKNQENEDKVWKIKKIKIMDLIMKLKTN